MKIKPAVSLNPGDIITLADVKFAVLDIIDGNPFVVALTNQGNSRFGDSNNYANSTLRNVVENWLEDLDLDTDLVMEREIDLTTLDGYKGYGKLKVKAAPLTMDEARKYAELIPDPDDWSWLATGWGAPEHFGSTVALYVYSNGGWNSGDCSNSYGIRPALVLPSTLLVSDDGTIFTNTPPTITSASGASGVNLGSKTAAFSFTYKVADADGDKLTVTEKLDGTTMKTRTNISSGTTLTFEYPSTAANFQKILNGSHVLTVEVSDGKKTATFKANFTKAVYEATITLKTPLAVAGDITAAVLSVVGDIPAGAIYKVEVTNNAKDTSPAWQDVTSEVKSGVNIVFTNKTAANGAAFNFRITVKRGTSTGGYISGVGGAFQ